jgi:hypothetical protein
MEVMKNTIPETMKSVTTASPVRLTRNLNMKAKG